MAVEKLIVDHIDTWTTARQTRSTTGRGSSGKIDLYGIKKLRELILELAVRGKLVPQDPNDEPASVLLKRIAAEKAELVKQGKIKKQKPLPEISEEEKPFELPVGWEWVRLGEISDAVTGNAFKTSEYSDEGTFVLRVTNINPDGSINLTDSKFIPHNIAENKYSNFSLVEGDILLVMVGGSLGKIGIVDSECLPALLNQNMWKMVNTRSIRNDFFIFGLKFINANQLNITHSTHGHLAQGDYLSKCFPLAPKDEQTRIINKVNVLMSLCDQLEQHSLTSLDAHQQLVETLLTTLTDSQNADELAENWARISEHFDTLFTTEASIDALKQTILQLAVMGKLVPQDSNDEPASELLKRIAQEKAQLVKDGKIKKQKPLPPISDEEKPFEIPTNWEWVRFGTITTSRLGKMLDKAKNKGTPKKYIRNVNVQWDNISIDDVNEMKFEDNELSEFILRNGDLLICEGGEPGRCAIWNKPGEFYFQKALHRVRTFCNIPERILAIHLKNDSLNGRLANLFTGVTIKHLPGDKLQQYVIPLMPLNEQTNIIEKLNFLLDICDSLSKEIKSSQQTQLHMADALTDAAIN
ncbi:restriction endonuclease subunit S [Salmonella enterica subsp. enterica serovar Soerenga]|uniref:restriction endonuclease subunit S n=1 Tax=Salmonella enterica TaxID=28901 RepID=UPI0003BD72EA|nr:restriction endonuclease subunit S [Salmonella enterica]EHJ4340130.1 restriction endonuclease subunit S [Salmonella enterica subsp. enterica serovar Soerenga]EHK4503423.1 restriction endonuclease subunit S [Salmonella enterica subsp. enterica serovar Soerenga]EHK8028160.1 restriction endonuclease subunit S [Salmonella enterica subsp. enterica serovar Soerenga]EHL2119356.1 restriction endonuclease subunit S [Salmonella enterica subsp. enterica serovar Soerenga]EHL9194921.1 restriction endonu